MHQIATEHPHKKLQPQGLTLVVIPQYVVTQQVAASSCFWHIFRTWCQVTTKLPAQVFVSIQLDLNASWIAHLFIIPLPSLYVLGSEVKPFLWLPPPRPTCGLLLALLSRNLPAASPIVQQHCTLLNNELASNFGNTQCQ